MIVAASCARALSLSLFNPSALGIALLVADPIGPESGNPEQ